MGSGFEHAALAVFTTLAPMGAGAFIVLTYAFLAGKPDQAAAKRLDRWTALPLAVLAVGFAGAFMHLASPLGAFGVFAGVGSSPLSNEILAGVLFVVAAVIYWALGLAGKLSEGARRAFLIALSVLAVVFSAFCGLAYMMHTIPTWNTPTSIVQMVGFMVAGGTVLGFCTVGLAKVGLPKGAGTVALALTLAGVVIASAGFGMQIAGLEGIRNIWGSAAQLVPAIGMMLAAFAACGLLGAVLAYVASKKAFAPALMVGSCAIVAVGVFVARIGFYGLFMGIAL
ncbi:dimethyl sulfoxide reductase anchor subunit [Paraeggerthella hongkongensis]|uniref:dimethyl sulfoxide reductase anchor subunit family protein n=1 Tax=Paraeggerthella TaxID=651554 RepID=UPI001C102972|nr:MULTISPECIES: DmsC/YnfH family molybdoenzyme membrane anchor subunit [Paraeggerthella]MBU5406560.1 dimethyl sulfoxide reductase anchor subunit [Paraeggerthella hongkongensis]MCD2434331.1 dimethyl sulfoxide reductase anchor subunit [Paraeggerthella hominis]